MAGVPGLAPGFSVGGRAGAARRGECSELAATGAGILLAAMASAAWEETRERFADFLARGDTGTAAAAVLLLEDSRAILSGVPAAERGSAGRELEAVWAARLAEAAGGEPGGQRPWAC